MLKGILIKVTDYIIPVGGITFSLLGEVKKNRKMEELIDKKVDEKVQEVLAAYMRKH